VLLALSFSHFLNDMLQSLIVALYPLLKGEFHLSFAQIGAITLTYQICASLLQPFIGRYTDKHPQPYSLSIGMGFTLAGLLVLAFAPNYLSVLAAAALIGAGSSIFHPESSRIARLASGGRHGLAQSIFQVGGNSGSAAGPLVAALIILPLGQTSIAWFAFAAVLAIAILTRVGTWYKRQHLQPKAAASHDAASQGPVSSRRIAWSMGILVLLLFSKYFYIASITSFYSFYLIEKFHVTVGSAQIHLFMFLAAAAIGTLFGGAIGDRVGRKSVIWVSVLGVAPFTLLLPYADLYWTGILAFIIGLVLSSAFSAILVFAQELIPGKVGAVSGLFFGFAFGIGGIGAAVLGAVADVRGIDFVYRLCAYLPLLGVAAAFLPNLRIKARTSGR
jgi:FSR family fosmidomycin resistance protein-like MFS transporter